MGRVHSVRAKWGRGAHVATEDVHVDMFVFLAVLEVVAVLREKLLVQTVELILCTHTTCNDVK